MSNYEPLTDIDQYVRDLVAPDSVTVHRVVASALDHPGHDAGRRAVWPWGPTIATFTLLLGVSLWWWQQTLAPAVEPTSLTISGDRTHVVAERPDGRRWLVTSVPDAALRGSYLIVMER